MFPYLYKANDTNKPRHIRRTTDDRADDFGVLGARVYGGLRPHRAVTGVHSGWESATEGNHILKRVRQKQTPPSRNIVLGTTDLL